MCSAQIWGSFSIEIVNSIHILHNHFEKKTKDSPSSTPLGTNENAWLPQKPSGFPGALALRSASNGRSRAKWIDATVSIEATFQTKMFDADSAASFVPPSIGDSQIGEQIELTLKQVLDVSFGLRYSNCIVGTVYCRRCEVFHFSLLMFSMVKLLMEETLHLKNL